MFDHLSKLDPTQDRTTWVDLPMIAPDAAVEVRYAGESNPGFYNAMLARSGRRVRAVQNKGLKAVNRKMVEDSREEDRDLYPQYILTGNWRGIRAADGSDVPCTLENRREFCAKLPGWIFDQLRVAAGNPERFLGDDEAPPDAQELAGNL